MRVMAILSLGLAWLWRRGAHTHGTARHPSRARGSHGGPTRGAGGPVARRNLRYRKAVWAYLPWVVCGWWGVQSARYVPVWRDDVPLWGWAAAGSEKPRVLTNYGVSLRAAGRTREGAVWLGRATHAAAATVMVAMNLFMAPPGRQGCLVRV